MKKIGEFAQTINRSPRALRLYEERGLLTPSKRSAGGFRLYGEAQALRVAYIDKLQELGCSLADIQTLIEGWRAQEVAHEGMRALEDAYRQKHREVCDAIEQLRSVERELSESLTFLEGCHACTAEASPQEACQQCTRSEGQTLTLIKGLAEAELSPYVPAPTPLQREAHPIEEIKAKT